MFYWPVRVYYEDTDSGGVVYYANYLKYLERARTEWLRSRGVEQDALARSAGVIFAVRALTVDYLRPARFNEQLHAGAAVGGRRAASRQPRFLPGLNLNFTCGRLITGDSAG